MYCDVISRRSITMKIGYGHVMLTLALALGLASLSTALDLTDFDEGELDATVVPGIPPGTDPECFCGINLAIMVDIRKGLRKEYDNVADLYSTIQEFIDRLAQRLDIGMQPTHNLVGVVTYYKFVREQFGLKNFTDKDSLMKEGIENIDFGFTDNDTSSDKQRSYPFKAMSHIFSNNSFFNSSNQTTLRPHNRNAVIVFDDGVLKISTEERKKKLKTQSERLKNIATVFVIGLRNKTLDFDAYDDGSMDTKDKTRIDNWITMASPTYEDSNNGRGNIITTSLWDYKGYLLDSLVDKLMTHINKISTCAYLPGEDPGECYPLKE